MKRITNNLLLLLVAMLLAVACKTKDPKPDPGTGPDDDSGGKKEQISKTWKVDALLINNSPSQGIDFSGYRFKFEQDGTYDFTAGPYTGTGDWAFNSNQQQLILDKGTANERKAVIVSLTDTKLELEFTEPSNGKTGEQKLLFKLK